MDVFLNKNSNLSKLANSFVMKIDWKLTLSDRQEYWKVFRFFTIFWVKEFFRWIQWCVEMIPCLCAVFCVFCWAFEEIKQKYQIMFGWFWKNWKFCYFKEKISFHRRNQMIGSGSPPKRRFSRSKNVLSFKNRLNFVWDLNLKHRLRDSRTSRTGLCIRELDIK